MTRPIREVLATLPSGAQGVALTDEELAKYLRDHCDRDVDQAREKRHRTRDAFYHDGGLDEMHEVVRGAFKDPKIVERICRMLPLAQFSNPTKRIVGELATVYAEPAKRKVGGDDANRARYTAIVSAASIDEQMDKACHAFNLHRAILIGPRVRPSADGSPEVVIDVCSAANARPVMHPNDNTQVVGWLTRIQYRTVRGASPRAPAWLLTTDHEWEQLDEKMQPITGTREAHGLGVNRWIPITDSLHAPDFWPGNDGEDLVSAHKATWLIEALMIKETRTASRVPVVQGDTSTMPRGVGMDSAEVMEAPEGTTITTVDIGTDIKVYMDAADHSLERAGNNYGLSLAALKHQGVQSAEARELMLAPVRDRRGRQVKIFRRAEAQLARTIAAVLAKYAPGYGFDAVEWSIGFGEARVQLSRKERLDLFFAERKASLADSVEFLMSEDPDKTAEQAWAEILEHIRVETMVQVARRPLMAISGALGGEAARADGADPGGPHDAPDAEAGDSPHTEAAAKSTDLSWVEEVVNAA